MAPLLLMRAFRRGKQPENVYKKLVFFWELFLDIKKRSAIMTLTM